MGVQALQAVLKQSRTDPLKKKMVENINQLLDSNPALFLSEKMNNALEQFFVAFPVLQNDLPRLKCFQSLLSKMVDTFKRLRDKANLLRPSNTSEQVLACSLRYLPYMWMCIQETTTIIKKPCQPEDSVAQSTQCHSALLAVINSIKDPYIQKAIDDCIINERLLPEILLLSANEIVSRMRFYIFVTGILKKCRSLHLKENMCFRMISQCVPYIDPERKSIVLFASGYGKNVAEIHTLRLYGIPKETFLFQHINAISLYVQASPQVTSVDARADHSVPLLDEPAFKTDNPPSWLFDRLASSQIIQLPNINIESKTKVAVLMRPPGGGVASPEWVDLQKLPSS